MGMKSQGFFVLSVLLLVGCGSGGGNNAPTGKVCPSVYDPLKVDVNPDNKPTGPKKLELAAGANGITQYPGTYAYDHAAIFYKNNKTGVQIHFQEGLDRREKQFKMGIVCVRGLRPDSPDFFIDATALSKMNVASTKIETFGIRHFQVQFKGADFPLRKGEDGDSSRFEAPSKVYEGAATNYVFFKSERDDVNFETRSYSKSGDEELYVMVHYVRTPPPPVSSNITGHR